ncbi:MAG: prolipoprotein diacylglyceryl transferase [Candidatus Komeilibacteria bacterium CG11_big_fil_rev_8_21_14_0_20_36_20]|uniref:Phosphatidylglycerol--prolipoprotein diacylglyceryl transferase n=1 Tax=Candidatus Komeilibacteria bacterium CG11_big_fil_rev_8_21_14_0_20_36_20 TaxID=1974477 RepID=A0A2H0NDA0_9BACT|nr:MAG: prolipoprotein diacylglyceryl transferase [Candidatus Komeilibacteria bacterium CG11_big_fil_rev_8_21_14_0_20_36_20]PIR81584.1 MAG: prolipoprotein diacylglyceryl transferase [Candidatus Komeilibacteria bacterium CG10_big_fil_rev_8_21_14_0_10_36_65]PJC55422.1 MAG: prolipoprotein diacylglyceryl transferase [Candidatus Komeilibacteria bacterium CG_4_9_14_0_2_um_filter_36_13]
MFFWQSYLPQPILFSVGPFSVHWYGLILVVAILVGGLFIQRNLLKNSIITKKQVEDLFFYLVIFGLISARLGHVIFFNLNYYLHHLADVLKVWQGGLSIQGAILGGLITLFFWSKKHQVNIWCLADKLTPALLLGQIIGRWGNYFNQELFGQPTDSWIGIPISLANRPIGFGQFSYFQPVFFYEGLLNLILFIILIWLGKKDKLKTGLITLLYLTSYSLIRFLMEFIRIDETPVILGWRLPQLLSLIIVVVGLLLLFSLYLKPLSKLKK